MPYFSDTFFNGADTHKYETQAWRNNLERNANNHGFGFIIDKKDFITRFLLFFWVNNKILDNIIDVHNNIVINISQSNDDDDTPRLFSFRGFIFSFVSIVVIVVIVVVVTTHDVTPKTSAAAAAAKSLLFSRSRSTSKNTAKTTATTNCDYYYNALCCHTS
jgi:hypothetical protein